VWKKTRAEEMLFAFPSLRLEMRRRKVYFDSEYGKMMGSTHLSDYIPSPSDFTISPTN
jgi:hypothetical protein